MLSDLLTKGYFPSELPPCFNTASYAHAVASGGAPKEFLSAHESQLCSFSLARAGNSRFRRRLSLVNPVNFCELSRLIVNNWTALQAHMKTSTLSRSTATYRPQGERALSPSSYSPGHLVETRARARGTAKVLLVADISEFYHSIYTHSISWALHTKAVAKANRNGNLLGDKLDSAVRKAQHGQTIGIPIGPDTSLVIAEVILAAVEQEVRHQVPNLEGFRFVDDFELCFPDQATAEKGLAVIQEMLLRFDLRLNPRKTNLFLPPINLEPEWISELRRFKIRDNSGQKHDLIAYFDTMTRLLRAYPNEHVSKYGLRRFKSFKPKYFNLQLLQSMLCHIGVAEPGSVREVIEALCFLRSQSLPLETLPIQQMLTAVLTTSTPLGHHYESAWALWAAIHFSIPLSTEVGKAVCTTENSTVAILALDASARGLITLSDTSRWQARMTQRDLREDEWLLSYEANIHSWLPTVGVGDHVASDSAFGFLKSQNVTFYR